MPSSRRRHHKIAKLSPEIVSQVNQLLTTPGVTYQSVVDFLTEKGIHVSHSSVGRYGKDFLSRLERLQVVKDQARAIVDESSGRPATEMAEAANQLGIQLIMETLMEVDSLAGEKISEVLKALALLERSGTGREKLKLEYRQRTQKAADAVEDTLQKESLPPETLKKIKEQIYGIVG